MINTPDLQATPEPLEQVRILRNTWSTPGNARDPSDAYAETLGVTSLSEAKQLRLWRDDLRGLVEYLEEPGKTLNLWLERLLDEGSAFVPPSGALEALSAEVACQRVETSPHSVAEIVAHMVFWQGYTLALARGEQATVPEHAADGWPSVTPEDWDVLRLNFLEGLAETKRVAREEDLERLVRGRDTLGYELSLHVIHNAVHLGQVILLRRMLGAWPPPAGGDTW